MNNFPNFFMAQETRPFVFLFIAADAILRGISLYKSAQRKQPIWFVALLFVNSLGILPLIYLLIQKDIPFSRQEKTIAKSSTKTAKRSKR